jgi:hypothetical protein
MLFNTEDLLRNLQYMLKRRGVDTKPRNMLVIIYIVLLTPPLLLGAFVLLMSCF